ncbi:hypothetical protein ASD68_12710 [Rhodanobacter sp. Root627]|uniref:hypothetical protein n=1 Tax=Rhodanobacter sp. Root627 TaxID=1736572 RepID=UPI0006FE0D8B|nr:hypothetical protein [Rhodanobacter sp. Root627]KRA33805.1 hypothetical protein ASD68_12710 [Rhodanobacter sp. Root627]
MSSNVTVAVIGVVAALLGSAIGAIASYFSTRSMRKLEWRLAQADREIEKRESLYAEFFAAANHGMLAGVAGKSIQPHELDILVNLDCRIWLLSPELGKCSRAIVSCVMDHYQKDKKDKASYPELREQFIVICRKSVEALRASV